MLIIIIFSLFSLVNSKSQNSLDTPNSTSSESSSEPVFSFDNHAVVASSVSASTSRNHPVITQAGLPERQPKIITYFDGKTIPTVEENTAWSMLWRSQSNFSGSRKNNLMSPFLHAENISVQEKIVIQTQAVVHTLREASQGISSGDISTKIPGLSPSDVNLILMELEKQHFVIKSGDAPILWFWVENIESTTANPCDQPLNLLNGFIQPTKSPCPKKQQYLKSSHQVYCNQKRKTPASTAEASPAMTCSILASSKNTTTTATSHPHVRGVGSSYTPPSHVCRSFAHVFESNLVNVFQQNGPLTVQEIMTKLDFRDEGKLRLMLQKLHELNILVEDRDQAWRLASSTRNNVGIIGEERKRGSPVQNEENGPSSSKSPTLLKNNVYQMTNGYHPTVSNGFCFSSSLVKETCHQIQSGLLNSTIQKENVYFDTAPNKYHRFVPKNGCFLPNARNSHMEDKRNGYIQPGQNNGHIPAGQKNVYIQGEKLNGFGQESANYVVNDKAHCGDDKGQQKKCSPFLPLKIETSKILDDLTVTTPKGYHKELYEIAMQENAVCYLPSGTGKHLVAAQLIAHMAILNPTKQSLVIVPDIVAALNVAHVLRKEIGLNRKRKKLNVALHAGHLKQSNGKAQVVVVTSRTCLGLLNCGALPWKDVCLLIFDQAMMCCNDDASIRILHDYYLKAKMDFHSGHVPKLFSFIDSSAGEESLEKTIQSFGNVLSAMGDVFLSCVTQSVSELEQEKQEAMFVCVQASLSEEELRMFLLLGTYLHLVFDNFAAQWQPLNSYKELLRISFMESSVISEAFVKLIHLTGQPLEKRIPPSCFKTWRHYLAISEVIFALVECGEDLARELLLNLERENFGFAWASDIGLPGFELCRQLLDHKSCGKCIELFACYQSPNMIDPGLLVK